MTPNVLIQLLRLRAEEKPALLTWLHQSSNKQTAHANQNEMLQIVAHAVLNDILSDMKQSLFLAIMVDETTDQSNKEQLTIAT